LPKNRKKWKRRIPIDIDAITGSAFVQALHPTARAGYVWLLLREWDSEDCTLAADPAQLAANAGLSPEDWAIHGPVILKKFDVLENGRLRNEVCFEAWTNVAAAYEAQRLAAERTNAERWGKPSSPTDALTVSPTDAGSDKSPHIHQSGKAVYTSAAIGEEMDAATRLFEKLGVPADFGTRDLAAQTIRHLSAHDLTSEGIAKAADKLLAMAQTDKAAGETINRFYFSDQKYLHKTNGKKAALDAEARVGRWDGLSDIDRAKKKRVEGKPLTEIERELLQEELTQ
jgi:hypothetical protein